MNTEMTKKINSIVKEHLPQAHAGVLKEFIEEAEENKDKIKVLELSEDVSKKEISDLKNTIKMLSDEIKKFNDIEARESALSRGELKLRERELKLRETILAHSLTTANDMNTNTMRLLELLFQNKTAESSILNGSFGITVPTTDQNGYQTFESIAGHVTADIKK